MRHSLELVYGSAHLIHLYNKGMIILSVGMPRAGSGWYYNLTHDLSLAAGAQDARQIREQYHLQKILTEVNCNIGALTPRRLSAVLIPSLAGNTFVIKAHAGPTAFASALLNLGLLRVTYIYRDPRDAMLSAYENGARAREKGRPNPFSSLVDFDTSLAFMKEYVHISEAWLKQSKVLHTRYEDLLIQYDHEVEQLAQYLRLDLQEKAARDVVEKYRPESPPPDQRGLHFSQGKIGRFRQKMSPEEVQRMKAAFEPYLQKMGYAI
jgi:hypothetical protein